ncbi:hypothetical protein [Paenibacillus glacialis]|uniref:hypothetical protein n=1 Tax=Paenibacillus glacialis TaxID=494026 RepID=UPI0011AB4720|nr:hypothetical protein [Paenibacillus glacialis]
MREIVPAQEVVYGKEDIAELENASIKVQNVYDKALAMLRRYLPQLVSSGPDDHNSTCTQSITNQGVFQKWIQGPKGWKCIGYEWQTDVDPNSEQAYLPNAQLQSMILQIMIWSQFEKIILLHPFLGQEAFYNKEELETISSYFVPTYMSVTPLIELGKPYKKHKTRVPIYQELISAPSLLIQSEGIPLKGTWMTGVYINQANFQGIGPYIKNSNGCRTFMEALIN